MELRSAFETLVRFAVVEQIADAVCRILELRCCSKYDQSDLWINKGNGIESRYEAGDLASEAEVFECVHDNLGICQSAKWRWESALWPSRSAHQFSHLSSGQRSLM